ncbi:UTP--glucose-1-phosphate uridylyltransferase [Akkermansiaceae bacterium]|nr:UTP--glucose-1-phosphate uridylyltransferase [Akkermansiaceae bacterium]MDB4294363.1 UTP--glucose-1-phosphate uridylyltransferase [Akkermansiaceae bacterium]MDB4781824.1 UTP--glucose-1-phosphate uridylyltransferase [Akkermansiaceae bacterium]
MTQDFAEIRTKMEGKGVHDVAIRSFQKAFESVASGSSTTISEDEITPADDILFYDELDSEADFDSELLGQAVIIKLNGGLGTSMGLEKVKSLLEVRPRVNFLDLMARQVLSLRAQSGQKVRFLLMNSQASSGDTLGHLAGAVPELGGADELELMQSWAPKLCRENLTPVSHVENPDLEWCPPGHADVYPSLSGSGWLERLLDEGAKYAFISNSDNLGAVLDPTLLSYFSKSGAPFMMEVTRRTDADRKGGHLAKRTSDGRLILREVAQCPEEDLEKFQDIKKHQFFNTNNVWINLESLRDVMAASGGVLALPVIKNAKTVDPRDPESAPVFQLETAMGSAIECFEGSLAVDVPRSRFAPVKSTSDLLALRSDAYELSDDGQIKLAPSRKGKPPVVKLAADYRLVDALENLGVPSLIGADEISISGPVSFSDTVEVIGKVAFKNKGDSIEEIPAGVYQNESWSV